MTSPVIRTRMVVSQQGFRYELHAEGCRHRIPTTAVEVWTEDQTVESIAQLQAECADQELDNVVMPCLRRLVRPHN